MDAKRLQVIGSMIGYTILTTIAILGIIGLGYAVKFLLHLLGIM
jgi:hypothetical protein